MDRDSELEQLRRSVAMLSPGASTTLRREELMQMLEELRAARGQLAQLRRDLAQLLGG